MTSSTTDVTQASIIASWVNLPCRHLSAEWWQPVADDVAKAHRHRPSSFASPIFFLAIACLGLAFLFYVRSLARLPLAVAYPVMVGVSLIVVAIANYYWLGTNLAPTQLPAFSSSSRRSHRDDLAIGVMVVKTACPTRSESA